LELKLDAEPFEDKFCLRSGQAPGAVAQILAGKCDIAKVEGFHAGLSEQIHALNTLMQV
jgi:hypothetical protein